MIREDYPAYPPLATREAIANAISHRDYAAYSGSVAIAMYDDRLEIINPGILHFDMTPEHLALPHESKPWNPIIASVFYRAGVIEKWGTGTLNIIHWCKENRNPNPSWEVRSHSVITSFHPSLFTPLKRILKNRLRPESMEKTILILLKKQALSKAEIARSLGHKQISGGLKKTLSELLAKEKITYTIPQNRRSRLQKYQINS